MGKFLAHGKRVAFHRRDAGIGLAGFEAGQRRLRRPHPGRHDRLAESELLPAFRQRAKQQTGAKGGLDHLREVRVRLRPLLDDLVEEILEGAPAAEQLRKGDIITKVDGKEVQNIQQLRSAIAAFAPGAEVKMDVFRDGKTQNIAVKLGEQPEDVMAARRGNGGGSGENAAPSEDNVAAALGLRVKTLTADIAERRGLDVKEGAIITEVERNSAAAREGLRPGDVIVEVHNQPVKNANDFQAAMSKEDPKKGVRQYVTSREGSRFVFVSTEK
jgi:C-terminal processing protease CtpA/Prc